MNTNNTHEVENTVQVRITDYLHQFAKQTPFHDALVYKDQLTSFQELESQVITFARALIALGIGKGDRVAVLCTPRPEYWVSFLAVTGIGAIWLGVNPKYSLDECRYVVGDAEPKLLFAISEFEGRNYDLIVKTLLTEHDSLLHAVALTGTIPGSQSFDRFLSLAHELPINRYYAAAEAVEPHDPALLVYTSGSSGRPKGALLSHYGLCFGATVQIQHSPVRYLKTLCCFPINHVACVADTCCVVLVGGGTLHLQERFDPKQVLECIHSGAINYWGAVPTMLLMVLDHPDCQQTDFSKMELIGWGGAALPEPAIRRLLDLVPRVMNVYGMTETSANVTFSDHDSSIEALRDTIGRPSPAMPCRIVNDEEVVCQEFETGELQFKGDYLFLGYLNRSEATREAFTADGWLRTGDLGYWREDGNITLVGRRSEMYKSGGYNIYPREIELLLESHPGVEMAAVVSMPDDLYQEVGAAFVVPKKKLPSNPDGITVDELKSFCKERLANYKVPKMFTVSKELPTLPVGKVDKVKLKKLLLAGLKELPHEST